MQYRDLAQSFWNCAIELTDVLISDSTVWKKKKDILLLADSVNKVSLHWACVPDHNKARQYNSKAGHCLEQFAAIGNPEILELPVYESFIWGRLTFHRDQKTLQNGYRFAKYRSRNELEIFALFLKVITLCAPEIITDASHQTHFQPELRIDSETHGLVKNIKTLLSAPSYKGSQTFDERGYRTIIDSGLAAMQGWLNNASPAQIESYLNITALQAGLLKNPEFAALVPLFFATFVSIQLTFSEKNKFADLAEYYLRSICKIKMYKWTRVLTDFFNNTLKSLTGKTLNLE
eukprot:TRINITY_DN478_c0_g1_i1.p1 TRINITY_DN478_c0_g1~~TRINITY_DN478_c0_g1_i1.p1  ORF type:complete len:290 (+),score=35.69 TRINITY_DN478_c0_g1_i1:98-967(+)